MGKVDFWDSLCYLTAKFAGAAGVVGIAAYVLRGARGHLSCAVRGDGTRHIWQCRGNRGRSDHFLHPDNHHPVHFQSRITDMVYALRRKRRVQDPYFEGDMK